MSEERETNHNNSRAWFGYDFQVNAGIMIMMKNIRNLKSIRVEGKKEDIEICLDGDRRICAQAKSVYSANNDFNHVLEYFSGALKSLNDANKYYGEEISQLIYVTNSPNPLKEQFLRLALSGETIYSYDALPPESQEIVCQFLERGGYKIPIDKFFIYYIPFVDASSAEDSDNQDIYGRREERYNTIRSTVNEFVSGIDGLHDSGVGKKLMEQWQLDLFQLSTIKETKVVLNKKQIIWPLILIVLENTWQDSFFRQFEVGVLRLARSRYGSLMQAQCERWTYVTRILADYQRYLNTYHGEMGMCIDDFISVSWQPYADEFKEVISNLEVREVATKIVMYNVIMGRIIINEIKEYVNL